MSSLDTDTIRHALESARKSGFRVVRLRDGDVNFQGVLSVLPEVEEVEEEEVEVVAGPVTVEVESSAVGYVRFPNKIKVGDEVESGQVVAEIVALGIANDVLAKSGGTVTEVHVKDNDPLEYGQSILTLERK